MSKKCAKPFLHINKFSVLCSYWKSDKTVKSKQLLLSVLLTLFSHNAMTLLTAGTKPWMLMKQLQEQIMEQNTTITNV